MSTNRMTQHLEEIGLEDHDWSGTPPSAAFMMAPIGLSNAPGTQLLQWAYEKAQAVARPSWPERDVLGKWN